MSKKRVIIVGAGFGGLNVARDLRRADVDVLIIDKTNHHLFQPLLYQVASAALSPGNIASPIRQVVTSQKNTSVIMGEVISVDKTKKSITLKTGEVYFFDYLVLAPGARHSYFGKDEWENFAPGLKTIDDALLIREKIFRSLEEAEKLNDPQKTAPYLRYIVIGGGPTGVEMAGAIGEITRQTLKNNYRNIDPTLAEIYLIEGEKTVLPFFPPSLGGVAKKYLEELGVHVMTETRVTNVTADGVQLGEEFLAAKNIIWAAGNQASPILKTLDVPLDRAGRVLVNQDLSLPESPEIFVIGDAACWTLPDGKILPGIAPVAIQEGRYVAKIIKKDVPQENRKPFSYFDKGSLATIGKAKAVGLYKNLEFKGFIAWLIWSFVHIFYLISYSNRVVVMIQWMIWYMSDRRQARIITNRLCTPLQEEASKSCNK